MIEDVEERLRYFFKTNEIELRSSNEILLNSWILIKYVSNDEIYFESYYNIGEPLKTNLGKPCLDVQDNLL